MLKFIEFQYNNLGGSGVFNSRLLLSVIFFCECLWIKEALWIVESEMKIRLVDKKSENTMRKIYTEIRISV